MTTAPPTTSVLDEVATWPGVSTQPTPRGATAIVLDGHELGHVHADRRTLDMPLSGDRRERVLAAGRAKKWFSSWVSKPLTSDADAQDGIGLLREGGIYLSQVGSRHGLSTGGTCPGADRQRWSWASGARVDDQASVRDGVGEDGLLEQSVEEQATTPGPASVEAERELVEVRVEVLWSDGPLVGAKQPALEQARDAMNARHDHVSGIVLGAHDGPLVLVAAVRHSPIGLPPVGVDSRARLDRAFDERDQAVLGDIVDALQSNPPETLGFSISTAIATIAFVSVCRPNTPPSTPPR